MTKLIVSRPRCERVKHDENSDCAYRIAWSINPHMQIGATNTALAVRQHASLVRSLRQAGADVEIMPFVHGAFDSVFTKDSAIVTGMRALLASPRHPERVREQDSRWRDLADAGFEVTAPLDVPLEGGDVVIDGDVALLGYGFRSSVRAAPRLSVFLGRDVLPLDLRDPMLYHLDTALTVLADGTVLFAEEAFSSGALRALARLPAARLRTVPHADALAFGLNVVEVGDAIITGTRSATMDALWRSLGKRVIYTPLDQFQRAGGSAACLVAKIHQDLVAESATTAILSTAA